MINPNNRTYPIADMHCDTISTIAQEGGTFWESSHKGHIDLPRLRKTNVLCQFFAVCVDSQNRFQGAFDNACKLFESFKREASLHEDEMQVVTDYPTFEEVTRSGRLAAILSVEGGETLEGDLENLIRLYNMGVRALTLTWNWQNDIAYGVGVKNDPRGLTSFGKDVVRAMNELGMVIDVSHLAEPGFWDCVELSKKPIIASHSNAWALAPHGRNLRDSQIRAIAETEGVIGINFFPYFLRGEGQAADLSDVIDHIEHVIRVGGIDSVAFGSDFDGVAILPKGMQDVTDFSNIISELIARGFTYEEIDKILFGNVRRVLSMVL